MVALTTTPPPRTSPPVTKPPVTKPPVTGPVVETDRVADTGSTAGLGMAAAAAVHGHFVDVRKFS